VHNVLLSVVCVHQMEHVSLINNGMVSVYTKLARFVISRAQ